MKNTIQALRDEIEAAEKKRSAIYGTRGDWDFKVRRYIGLTNYIKGLQTAVRLLEQEPARELPY